MNFKSLIEQLDQLSEVTKETPTGRVHTAEPGGYGRQYDTDEEGTETQMPVEPVQKRGRGRPKLGSDKFGNVPKYEFAKQLQDFMVGNLPSGKLPGKPGKKHKISDKEAKNEAVVVTTKQGVPIAQVADAQTAQQLDQSIESGKITMLVKEMFDEVSLQEKWDTETKVSPEEKGKYAGKTKEELLKQYNALKKTGPHKKGSKEFGRMRELAFAIRAKSGWGKVKEQSVIEAEMPTFDSIAGAGLGAGRSDKVLENDQQLTNKYGPIPAQELEQLKKQAHKNAVEAEPTGFGPRYDMEYKTALEKLLVDRKSVKESKKAKPDFLDLDKDGNKKESMKSAAKQAKQMQKNKHKNKEKLKEVLPALGVIARPIATGLASALIGSAATAAGTSLADAGREIDRMVGVKESFENWDKQLSDLLNEDLSISMTKGEDNVPTSFNINVSGENVEDFLPIIKKLSAMSDIADSELDSHSDKQIDMDTYQDHTNYGDMASMIGKMDYLDSDYKDEDQHGEMNVCEVCHEQACRCDEEMLVDEESHDMMQESYANSTDDAYQTDEEFLINTISSGLNKKKSTGQSTIPVVASQTDRLVDSIDDWVKLSGIKK